MERNGFCQLWSGLGPEGTNLFETPYLGSISSLIGGGGGGGGGGCTCGCRCSSGGRGGGHRELQRGLGCSFLEMVMQEL